MTMNSIMKVIKKTEYAKKTFWTCDREIFTSILSRLYELSKGEQPGDYMFEPEIPYTRKVEINRDDWKGMMRYVEENIKENQKIQKSVGKRTLLEMMEYAERETSPEKETVTLEWI